jgi:hypothetical protein
MQADAAADEIRLDDLDEISLDEEIGEVVEEEAAESPEEEISLDEVEFDWSEQEELVESAEALEEITLEEEDEAEEAFAPPQFEEQAEETGQELPALEEDEVLLTDEEHPAMVEDFAPPEPEDLTMEEVATAEVAEGEDEEEIVLEERELDELIEEEKEEAAVQETIIAEPGRFTPPAEVEAEEAGPLWEDEEEEKLHNDARRFARLLVSEIKLYNEEAVAEGRLSQDLYHRLKRDIDRSREMYEKRVSDVVARKFDYFHEEMVRILGEGDVDKLGGNYPGPQVRSGE